VNRQDEPSHQTIAVDWKDLSPVALRNVLEDLVSRGEPDEMALELRCQQLLTAIKQGKTRLYFDPIEETIFLRNPSVER
jgi:uncharacterized protein YheU (UPF0270 family)